MQVKYVKVGIYKQAGSTFTLDRQFITDTYAPVLIAQNDTEWSRFGSTTGSLNYVRFLEQFETRFDSIDIPSLVSPAFFSSDAYRESYNQVTRFSPSPIEIDFPCTREGTLNYYSMSFYENVFVPCADFSSSGVVAIETNRFWYTPTTNYGAVFYSNCGTNYIAKNRAMVCMPILQMNDGLIVKYGHIEWWFEYTNNYTDGSGYFYVYKLSTMNPSVIAILNNLEYKDSPQPVGGDDPYSPGGESGTGGGTGTFSDTGDTIGIPALPTLSAVDTGFISLFNPTSAQIKSLANYMWSQNFDLSLFKNIVANPIECILGLTIVPVDPPNAGAKALTVGNIQTDVVMSYLSSQYVEVDCGTLNIAEFWGSYLDYSPYTKIQLYLPYIGIVPVDIDDMQNSSVHVVYHIDVLSGACVAYVLCGGTQLYTYIGQCSSNIPLTSNDFTNTVNGILSIAGAIGSLVASEGATAPHAVGTIASASVNILKPNIQKSGSLSGTGGMMGVQTPYLICQRPRQSVPARQNHYTGYPSNITYTLSDLTGYTEVQDIHLDNVPCTDAEMNEILEYLTGGVVI